MAAILNFLLPLTQHHINTDRIAKQEPTNIGVSVGIPLRLCIEGKISVVLYSLPVYGRHLEFLSDIDKDLKFIQL